jgi:integrase
MATIKAIKGKKGTTYRVEAMIDGIRLPSKTFKTKPEAERQAAILTLKADAVRGYNFRYTSTTTLSCLIDEYLSSYDGKDSSRQQRLNFWKEQLGHLCLDKIQRDKVKSSLRHLLNSGKSNATFNRYKSALSAVFRFAEEEYDIDFNPCTGIRNKPESQPIDRWASHDELSRLLEACRQSSWSKMYLYVLVAVHTGMRRSSCLALRWSSIDFDMCIAYIPTSKNKKPIMIPLNDEVMVELLKHREVGNGFIFNKPEDKSQSFKHFDYHWRVAKQRADITDSLRIHDLRHTTGSLLGQAGVPLTEIRDIMTHKSIQTTQRYVHHNYQDKALKLKSVLGGIS